jgi:methionyl-tRNA formyltransferase
MKIVLASNKQWHAPMARRLHERLNVDVALITDQSELSSDKLHELRPTFVFFPHWSQKIPRAIYETYTCIIFHMTDLPYGRGGSPLQNLIANGIDQTKISAVHCVEELDAGPVYLKRDLSLHGAAEEIFLRASDIIEDMIVEIVQTKPQPVSQSGPVTQFHRRKRSDGNLGNLETLDQFFDYVRMLDADGYPKAFLDVGAFQIQFSRISRKYKKLVADVIITERESE